MRALTRFAVLCALLLPVAPLFAALGLHPHAPTTADAITLRSGQGCPVRHTVSRNGSEISVDMEFFNCSPPIPYVYEIPLGQLPAGRYRATLGSDSLEFVVREAAALVRVRPSVITANTASVELQLHGLQGFSIYPDPDQSSGAETTIEIGGVRVTQVLFQQVPTVIAPALGPGWKDLRVTDERGTFLIPAAVYYHAAGSEPDAHAFERVLFPVLTRADGAAGSSWRSEAVILNPTRFPLLTANDITPDNCVPAPCGDVLLPGSRMAFSGEGFPNGVALLVPRDEAESLAFSLRARDVSRGAHNYGTEIPVVRERAMARQPESGPITTPIGSDAQRNDDLALLDIPRDTRYRIKVRLYAFRTDAVEISDTVVLRIFGADGVEKKLLSAPLRNTCSTAPCASAPRYAEFDLEPGTEGERSDLFASVPTGTLAWAFASITNNDTQQVTVVTLNGKSGRHCANC